MKKHWSMSVNIHQYQFLVNYMKILKRIGLLFIIIVFPIAVIIHCLLWNLTIADGWNCDYINIKTATEDCWSTWKVLWNE